MRRFLPVLLFAALASTAASADDAAKFDATERYAVRDIEGWNVRVHPLLLNEESGLGERVLTLLRHQLYQIDRRLPAAAVATLRRVTIWVERDEPHHPCMAYHPDAGWLADHDMNPDKARCVEIADAETFLTWTIQQPWMVLHELAHAYHHQFLEGGFENADVVAVYERAKAAGNYDDVSRINGHRDRHYALTNPMEYFAEASEAYFGTNDFYPYVRSEFAEHDPAALDLLGRLWGDVDEKKGEG